jgi:hypothetical protein
MLAATQAVTESSSAASHGKTTGVGALGASVVAAARLAFSGGVHNDPPLATVLVMPPLPPAEAGKLVNVLIKWMLEEVATDDVPRAKCLLE